MYVNDDPNLEQTFVPDLCDRTVWSILHSEKIL